MILIDFVFAFLIAMLLAVVMVPLLGWRHPRTADAATGLLFLFLLMLAVVWAGGVWSPRYGPMLWGGYWLPFLVVGVIAALIILAIGAANETPPPPSPDAPPGTPERLVAEENRRKSKLAGGAAAVFGLFFWILLIAAAVAVVVRYLNAPAP